MKSYFDNKMQYFMTLVYLVAMKSKDESTKIGAVITDNIGRIISTGYNGPVRGMDDKNPKLQIRPDKYMFAEHAERNAIYQAKVPLDNCIMYTMGMPCADCGRAIIQSGIKRVVLHEQWEEKFKVLRGSKWSESQLKTKEMFEQCDVGYIYYNEPNIIKNINCVIDGKEIL